LVVKGLPNFLQRDAEHNHSEEGTVIREVGDQIVELETLDGTEFRTEYTCTAMIGGATLITIHSEPSRRGWATSLLKGTLVSAWARRLDEYLADQIRDGTLTHPTGISFRPLKGKSLTF
jgi:hypothetical protein